MKRFLLLPDKFKGSLTAEDVMAAMQEGIISVYPEAEISSFMASDGGDGFHDAIACYRQVSSVACETVNAIGKPIQAPFLFNQENNTAYIELASASGLAQLPNTLRDPMKTSTYGTGIQIKQAISIGATKIYVGLGGSATNDGGIGIANALGYQFLDAQGNLLRPKGENLDRIADYHPTKDFSSVEFYAVNDVSNPLCGKNGASIVYGPQKGASEKQVIMLDSGLQHLNTIVIKKKSRDLSTLAGAGAAGGTAFGLMAFFNAEFLSGIDFIFDLMQVDKLLKEKKFDYLLTGEGSIDEQTLNGKLIDGVLRLGDRHRLPVIAFCGKVTLSKDKINRIQGFQVIETAKKGKSLDFNMENAYQHLFEAISNFFKTK